MTIGAQAAVIRIAAGLRRDHSQVPHRPAARASHEVLLHPHDRIEHRLQPQRFMRLVIQLPAVIVAHAQLSQITRSSLSFSGRPGTRCKAARRARHGCRVRGGLRYDPLRRALLRERGLIITIIGRGTYVTPEADRPQT